MPRLMADTGRVLSFHVYFRVMRRVRTFVALSILLFPTGRVALTPLQAQGSPAVDPALLTPLQWRSIGPANTGGRVDDLAVARVPGLPDAIYVGTASGGIFKSTNQGTSWTPVFDRVDAMMSIGDLAVAPSNPNVVWAGTGEANNRQSSSWGDGIYRSLDGGRTWKAAGLAETRHIGRVLVHPSNPDVVYVAAVGHLWGSNSERGVFKTTDGATARAGADTRLAQLQAEIAAELMTASALSRAIEGYSGLPTSDQRRQIDWVVDDGSKTVDALNRVLRTEMPAPAPPMDIPAKRR